MGLRRRLDVHRTESRAPVQCWAGLHHHPGSGGPRRQIAPRQRMGRLGKIRLCGIKSMTNKRFLASALLLCSLALVARAQTKPADPAVPHLEKRGQATQLMVDGKPVLVLLSLIKI